MSVRIRFTRIGRPHAPFYRLVATDRRNARDAAPIEVLGTFNPRNMKALMEGCQARGHGHWDTAPAEHRRMGAR